MVKDESLKGAFWIDKLKDLFKNEQIEEEEESWMQNSNSQENLQGAAGFESQSDKNDGSADTNDNEISFLKHDDKKGKEFNRQIYQKIADAFLDENSMINLENEESFDEEEWKQQFSKQQKKVTIENDYEFGEIFDDQLKSVSNKENLDIVEMDVFDRIKLYQDHSICQKIYKKCWYIKSLITNTAFKLIKSSQFETLSLLVILFNSVTLAMDDPTTTEDNNASIEFTLLVIYTVEMFLKIIGLGFVLNEGSYLRDMWNVVDIVIIGTGYLPYLSSSSSLNLSALRSLRVLRPLKSVSKIKSLKLLLQALFSAIPLLKDSLIVLGFFFIIFGIAGLQLFIGQLKSRCIDPTLGIQTGDDTTGVVVCATDNDCASYISPTGVAYMCGKMMISPFYDTIQFDTFGWSVLSVYVVVTLEGWTQIMNLMQQGFSMYSFFYFFFAVYIGAFFLLNLTMAIIGVKYSEAIKDQKKKVVVAQVNEGFSIKNLIEWGIYKSNKIYYKELEEERKAPKVSFFGFSINGLTQSLKSVAALEQTQTNMVEGRIQEQEMNPIQLENKESNSKPAEENEKLIPQDDTKDKPLKEQTSFEEKMIGKGVEESAEIKKIGNENQKEGDRPNIPKGIIIPPLLSAKGLGNSLRSLSNKQTKTGQKKVARIEVGHQNMKIGVSSAFKISPRGNGDPINESKVLNGVVGSSQFAATGNGDEILEDQLGSRSQVSSDQVESQSNTIIMPHLMVGQLELINKKSDDSFGVQKEKSRVANYKGRHRSQQRTFKPILSTNMKTLSVGDRQINLAPIQSKMKDQMKQAQQEQMQQQALIKQENHNVHSSRRLSTHIGGNLRSLRQTQKIGDSQASPRDILDSIQDEYDMAGSDQLHHPIENRGRGSIQNTAARRQSKRGVGILPKTDMLGSVRSNTRLHGALIGADDWIDNDDFLNEIEQKEKAATKFLSNTDFGNGGQSDHKIEEAYLTSGIGMSMLKDSKKNAKDHFNGNITSSGSFHHENNFKININKDEQGKERSGSNQRRILSGKRLRNGHSSHSNSNSLNQNSHTKQLTIVDNLSEESDMSIYQVNTNQNNNVDDSAAASATRPKHGITIFNDLDFLDVYTQTAKKEVKVATETEKQQKKSEKTKKLKSMKEEYVFKRQESRKVNRQYQGNLGLIDENFDLKREETRLLLDSKYLKARVLYNKTRDYIDDILPTKKENIRKIKKLEQARKLKSLPFTIYYTNSKRIAKPKKKTNLDQTRIFPLKKSRHMATLLKDRNVLSELDHENLDQFIKDSKNGSQLMKRNASFQNAADFQSHMSPVFKLNDEVSGKQSASQNNIEEGASMRDVVSQKFIDNINGQLSNPHLSQSRISGDGDADGEAQIRSIQEIPLSIKKGQTLQRQITSNKLISEGNINGSGQFNNGPSFQHQTSLSRSKTKRFGEGQKSETIGAAVGFGGDDSNMNLNRSKVNSTAKGGKNLQIEKGKARKKEQDIKWTSQIAMDRIFNEQEQTEEKKKVQTPLEIMFGQVDAANSQSVGDRTLFSATTKSLSVGKSSDSFSSKSGVNSDTASMQSFREFDPNEQEGQSFLTANQAGGESKAGGEPTVDEKTNEMFASETIENEFIKIRKKEIQNIEKRGIRTIVADWSADSVLNSTFNTKSQNSISRMIKTLNHDKFETDQYEGGILGIIQAIRRRMKNFAHSSVFENTVMLCVMINTVILSLDGIVTSESGQAAMSDMNYIFTIIFAADMFLKVLGEGISTYVSDKMNIFDALIVNLSLFEMIFLTGSGSSFSAFRAVRILRVFRVLRVTRLIRSLQFMKLMMTALGSAIQQFIYILLLLFLFMFIYTLLGMSIFGGSLNITDSPTRMSFDTFFKAWFAVLQLLTNENWNDLLTLTIRSQDVNNYISIFYLISWIFIGNYVFMNLLLAVIMDSFDSAEVQADKEDIEAQFEVQADLDLNHQSIGTTFLNQTTSLHLGSQTQSVVQSQNNLNRSQTSLNKSQSKHQSSDQHSLKSNSQREKKQSETDSIKESQQASDLQSNADLDDEDEEDEQEGKEKKNSKKNQFVYFDGVKCQKTFYLLSQENIIRKIFYRIYKHPLFDRTILMAIILSSLKLTIDTYVTDTESTFYSVGLQFDLAFTVIFALESLIKIISLGFVLDEASYLRDEWSQLDLFIVACSLIDVSVSSIDLSAIKVLRLLRTLRPLRLLNHNKSMKLIVTALMESVGGIANMVFVVLLIWLMFAILGLNLMQNKLDYCDFNSSTNYSIYAYHKDDCDALGPPAVWSTYDINCDNIGSAMLFLFILSSFEGWPDYVWYFIDADESGPIKNGSSYFAGYFFIFIFVGSFFSINLFSAIMSFNFDIAQKKAKNKYLSDDQSMWIELQRMIVKSNPDFASLQQPENKFRYYLWKFVQSSFIEVFIITCILANIVTMAMAYDTSPASYDAFLQNVNLFFSGVFFTECILKLIAFGPAGYFFSSWNRFDFFVVLASILDFSLTQVGSSALSFLKSGPQLARAMRVLRVSRLLKLIKSFQNLQKLIQTTIYALPSLMNATALFMLFYFIFAILANFLFGSIDSGERINSLNNFSNFHSSFVILFRCSTGEDWMVIMFDTVKKTNTWSVMFFVLFIVTQSYIMMNLFVLIIINQFEENYIDPDNPLQNFREQEESFKKLWVIMTKKESGIKIHERFIPDFYFELKEPLGYDYTLQKKQFIDNLKLYNRNITEEEIQAKCDKFKVKQRQEADKRIMQMNIFCDYEGFIYFNELFFFLFRFSLDEEINDFGASSAKDALERKTQASSILRKEEIITIKKISYLKKKQSALMKQKIIAKRKEGVNPMVRRLFVGMCFASWLQFSKNTQKKINSMKFNEEDISSESDTDSSNEADEKEKDDFFKAEDDEGIQFRSTNNKKAIIQREHTIFKRNAMVKDREADNLIEQDKYIFLPNTDIYKDDFVQMGEGPNYYSMRVFSNQPENPQKISEPEKNHEKEPKQNENKRISIQISSELHQNQENVLLKQKQHEEEPKSHSKNSTHFKADVKEPILEEDDDNLIPHNIQTDPRKNEELKAINLKRITINKQGNNQQKQ